jgi:rhodanese-related sulfurtransferase
VALQLRHNGITRVHPLHGGLAAWMDLGYPVEAVRPPVIAAISP